MNGAFLILILSASLTIFANSSEIGTWKHDGTTPKFVNKDANYGNCKMCHSIEPSFFKFIHYNYNKYSYRYTKLTIDSKSLWTCIRVLKGDRNSMDTEHGILTGGAGHHFISLVFRNSYKHISIITMAYNVDCEKEIENLKHLHMFHENITSPLLRESENILPNPTPNETLAPQDAALRKGAIITPIPKTEAVTRPTPKSEAVTTIKSKTEAVTTITPKTEAVTTITTKTDAVTIITPKIEDVTTITPKIEAVTTITPKTEDVTTITPKTEDVTTITPKTEAVTTATPTEDVTTATPTEAVTTPTPTEAVGTPTPTEAVTTAIPPAQPYTLSISQDDFL